MTMRNKQVSRSHSSETTVRRLVDIGRLKGFTLESFPSNSWLRNVLLLENNRLTVNDFLAIARAHQAVIEKTFNNARAQTTIEPNIEVGHEPMEIHLENNPLDNLDLDLGSQLLEDLVEPLYEAEPLIDQVELNDIGQLEPIEELYPIEPMIEPFELDLIGDIEPLAEEGVEVL